MELTDSLSEAEERRDLPLLCRLNWLLMSEVWLVTVERRVDTKLLLLERRSRCRTHSNMPRHGMYLANANLYRDTESLLRSGAHGKWSLLKTARKSEQRKMLDFLF